LSQLLIQHYLNELQTLRRVSGTSRESVVREAFKTLLKDWGKSRDLNTLAAAVIAAGLFGPVAALVYQLAPVTIGTGYMIAVAFGCLALGGVLHLLGLVFLRRLRA
jgi:hypothetical protein